MTPESIDVATARRFMRRAVLLDQPVPTVTAALDHLGYVQLDPINVCGRMHDLILRPRVRGYREGDLMRHLHGETTAPASARTAFEHHLPSLHTLVALPVAAWPYLQAAMRRRSYGAGAWSGRLSPRQRELAVSLLATIEAQGPMCAEDFAGTGRARAVWGSATQAKATLQKLFFHGRLLIARRSELHRRYYDLPSRVLPPGAVGLAEPGKRDVARWEVILKLRQRRLVMLKRTELPLVADAVQALRVPDCPLLHCLRSDLPLLEAVRVAHPGRLRPSPSSSHRSIPWCTPAPLRPRSSVFRTPGRRTFRRRNASAGTMPCRSLPASSSSGTSIPRPTGAPVASV